VSDDVRTYYGTPVVRSPEWTWEVPWYLFAGGLAGASSVLAFGARLAGNDVLADRAGTVAAAGAVVSPALLVADLGRPKRFLNMLRVFKPTSPMSVGSWILALYGPPAAGAVTARGVPPLARTGEAVAALLGPAMAAYTGVLVADSSIPVWHEARRELPFLFAGSAAATAGAAAVLATPPEHAQPARRLALSGAALEAAAGQSMQRRLGDLAKPYEEGTAGLLDKAAKACTAAGAGLLALGRRRPGLARAGAALVLAGGACLRWSVYKAGFASAADPRYTVEAQRQRLEAGGHAGAATAGR
jgi:hypothetical protein